VKAIWNCAGGIALLAGLELRYRQLVALLLLSPAPGAIASSSPELIAPFALGTITSSLELRW
jgi:hypothetical protein